MGVPEKQQEEAMNAIQSMGVEQATRREWLARFHEYLKAQGSGYRPVWGEVWHAYKDGENAEQAAAKFLERIHEGVGS